MGWFIPLLFLGGGIWGGAQLASDDTEINYNAPVTVAEEEGIISKVLPIAILGASGIAIYSFVKGRKN